MDKIKIIRDVVKVFPQVMPHLSDRARWTLYKPDEYKTYDFMLRQIEGLVRGVYSGAVRGSFIDVMANLISGQFTQAYRQAFEDEGFSDTNLPDYLLESLEAMILNQYNYVDQYYRDIIDAALDGKPIDQLLSRAQLWAQRWTEAYNEAVRLITKENGGNLEWIYGDTDHCDTCMNLNGIVMSAKEWDTLNVKPQSAPNNKLQCGGWKCQCRLEPTEKKRSPGAYGRVEEIVLASGKAIKGGEGSGNFGHAGRPGEVGGSAPGGGSISVSAQNTVDKLSERFGLGKVNVQMFNEEYGDVGRLGFNSTIELNEFNVNNPDSYSHTVSENPQDLVTHEYGHYVHQVLVTDDAYAEYGFGRPSYYYERGEDPPADRLGQDLYTISKQEGGIISEYATTNDDEYFSEAFVLYVRGETENINPRLLEVFRKLDNK